MYPTGVFGVSLSKLSLSSEPPSKPASAQRSDVYEHDGPIRPVSIVVADPGDERGDSIELVPRAPAASKLTAKPSVTAAMLIVGFLFALANGLVDGSLMVPFKMSRSDGLLDNVNYLASFGLSAGFVSPGLYLVYVFSFGRSWPTVQEVRTGLARVAKLNSYQPSSKTRSRARIIP
jgi:hypothetical protein